MTDNSANSGLQVRTLLNPDDSPPHNSVPNTPLSARIPNSAHSSALPSINQGFHDAGNRDSTQSHQSLDSRRSSVDSRMHQGLSNLYINGPTSPYESANTSQVSLAASLRRPNGAPISPLSGRPSVRNQTAGRIAPPILPGARAPGQPDPTAARPTQGFAWAFPDEAILEERHGSDSGESSVGLSRANSYAASSIRSSIFSTDSQMPAGQKRFDDGEAGNLQRWTVTRANGREYRASDDASPYDATSDDTEFTEREHCITSSRQLQSNSRAAREPQARGT